MTLDRDWNLVADVVISPQRKCQLVWIHRKLYVNFFWKILHGSLLSNRFRRKNHMDVYLTWNIGLGVSSEKDMRPVETHTTLFSPKYSERRAWENSVDPDQMTL